MSALDKKKPDKFFGPPRWTVWALPLIAIAAILLLFILIDPLAFFKANLPPIEELTLQQVRVTDTGFEVTAVNGGPDPVTIAQVQVDEAYWQFQIDPSATIPRLGRAKLTIGYPWVYGEPHEITVITATGVTFSTGVEIATQTPAPGLPEFLAYGLIGVYVGIIPVALGMLWFPAMRRLGREWLGAVLALTIGLLVFLLVDTMLESFDIAAALPEVFQGVPLAIYAALLTWLVLLAVGRRENRAETNGGMSPAVYLAAMIALGIGLHNLGEGLAIGVAFSIGEAALGSFLVIGFMLHNVTEGIGIAAPLLPTGRSGDSDQSSPSFWTFFWLALLAGVPAILGSWIGGFAYSPFWATLFFGIGAGAIWQVIVEVVRLLRDYARREGTPFFSWLNVGGFLVGLAVMYLTAFLVS